jgi:triphosphatase
MNQSRLVAQFSTDFLRRHWLIAFGDAEIELAWDQGEIAGALGRTGIDELELELKSGDARALFTLASKLAALGGLRLGAQSKAQRGYRLAGLGKPLAVQPLQRIEGKDQKASITLGMQHWQWRCSTGAAARVSLVAEAAGTLTVPPPGWPTCRRNSV